MDNLELIKRRLDITTSDQDELIDDLILDAESYFKLITGASEVTETYQFIIRDVALKMYVRRGSEGAESESVDGYSISYAQSLFEEYMPILERDFNLNSDMGSAGRVMWY